MERYNLMPKNANFRKVEISNWKQADKPELSMTKQGKFKTNFFQYSGVKASVIYLYKVETNPPIRPDANKTWAKVIKTVSRQLEREIGLITYRNDTLWVERQTPNKITIIKTTSGVGEIPPNSTLSLNRRGTS